QFTVLEPTVQGTSFTVDCVATYTTRFGAIRSIRHSGPYLYFATGDGVFQNGLEVWKIDENNGTAFEVSSTPTTVRTRDVLPYGSFVYTTPETGTGMQVFEM